ncbi:DUF2283 domain-containing protein [Candidatus Microgenomates bacterium]|nr:DUF2283 domain-containing protein [Candidatus Microgenomates bacterium]
MKVHYDKDEDILMIVLAQKSGKKVDDTYEMEHGYVSVDAQGEPVMVEIFEASKFFKEEGKVLPKEVKRKFFATA